MCNYSPQYLRQLNNCIQRRLYNKPCTLFHTDFRFWDDCWAHSLLRIYLMYLQKPAAANSKAATNITVLFSHMSDKCLKKVMIKWNKLFIIYIKTQGWDYLLKQFSIIIIINNFYSCFKSATSLQPGRFRGSDRLGCWWRRRNLLAFIFVQHNVVFNWSPFPDKSSNVFGEKGLSMPGLNTASMSNCEFSQVNSRPSRSGTW